MRTSWVSFRFDPSRPVGHALLLALAAAVTLPSAAEGQGARAANVAVSTEPVVTDVGPNHRRWTRQQVLQLPDGRTRTNVTSYVELESGLHRWDAATGQYVATDPGLEILPDGSGAVAHRSAHNVAIAANLNTRGAITVHTPDGKRLVCHVLGLAWFDAATGRSQMFAQVQDSIGELHGTDTVLFRDAFQGVAAVVRYSNRRDGFEQDVVLLESVTPPRGFNPETTRIEVWNEFLEAPAALLTQRARAGMTDDIVDWGAMQTGPGRAFLLGEDRRAAGAHVAKRWVTTADQRSFLVEAVRYPAAKRALDQLPARQAAVNPPAGAAAGAVKDLAKVEGFNGERPFPAAPKPRPANSTDRFRTAAAPKPAPPGQRAATGATADPLLTPPVSVAKAPPAAGYVIDYDLQNSITNLTLQCDTTYSVAGAVNLYGTTTIEGGAVIKVAPTNTAQINFNTAPIWATGPFRPAIFTARDDDSIGTPIAGSTGSPSGWYGGAYLNLSANATGAHLRVSYARTAVRFNDVSLTLRHAQFVHCSNVVEKTGDWLSAPLIVENALAYDSAVFLRGQCFLTGRHLTVHQCGQLVAAEDTVSATLNNSILADMDEEGSTTLTLNNSYNGSASGIFQTVGAAAHYLANGSPHRNAGNANLNSTTLNTERKSRTTYPPVVIEPSSFYSNSLSLGVQARRDTDTPDLGYLYDPLDFVLRGVPLTNATITVLPGTALAMARGNSGQDYGLGLFGGARFICEGTPSSLNRVVAQQMVQEQANTNWSGSFCAVRTAWLNSTEPVLLQARFTQWTLPAGSSWGHLNGHEGADGSVFLRDCQLQGGSVNMGQQTFAATNSLFHRVNFYLQDYFGTYTVGHALRHNTLIGAELVFDQWSADTWPVDNNLFVGTAIIDWGGVAPFPGHNGYVTNDVCQPLAGGVSNVVLSSLSFDEGPLGRFYLPTNGPATNLFNAGSTNAHWLGLWHFTTTTNNVKETNSVVDIGFHSVAVGSDGLPVDTDGDGLPDYLEDANGNGTLDHGETKVNDAADRGLRVFITRPRQGSTIP